MRQHRSPFDTSMRHQSLNIHYSRLQVTGDRLWTTHMMNYIIDHRPLTDDLHRQCVALVFRDGCADDLYTRQFEDKSRYSDEVAAEKVDVGTAVDVPIVR